MPLIVDPIRSDGGPYIPRRGPRDFADAGYCGASFNSGLLRFHDAASAPALRDFVFQAFPELTDIDPEADLLAFDWMGRQFMTAQIAGQDEVFILMADLASGSVEPMIPVAGFSQLLRQDDIKPFFDGDLYDAWRNAVGRPDAQLGFTDCVDFARPLYLGGEESVENLYFMPLMQAWGIGAQLRPHAMQLIQQGVDPSAIQFSFGE